jgi:hypothetical protein
MYMRLIMHNIYMYIYIYRYTSMTGAKYYVTRCSFGSLAAFLAGTLRDSCGARAKASI